MAEVGKLDVSSRAAPTALSLPVSVPRLAAEKESRSGPGHAGSSRNLCEILLRIGVGYTNHYWCSNARKDE